MKSTLKALMVSVFLCTVVAGDMYAQQKPAEMYIDTTYREVNTPYVFEGSSVSMIPPPYFQPFIQGDKAGFIHKGAGSSIQMQIIDSVIYTFVANALTEEELIRQKATLIEQSSVVTNAGKNAEFMVISFNLTNQGKEVAYERMMLLTGDVSKTVWISANYPVMARNVVYTVLKESLLTVEF